MIIKRIFPLIALLLLCNISAIETLAYDFESGGIYYNVLSNTDKTVSVTYKMSSYNSYKGQVEIPNKVSNNGSEYKVTEIGKNAFQDCPDLRSVIMPNSVTAIGEKAFYNSGIISVTIGTNVVSIGNQAFYGCRQLYKVIMLPNSVPSGLYNAMQSLNGRVIYVANSNFSGNYLGAKKEYKYLSSMFTVDGVRFVPVSPSDRTCDVIDYDYNSTVSVLTIKDKVINQGVELKVLDIQPKSFYQVSSINEINVSNDGIIGDCAFYGCTALQTVNASNKGSIGDYAFYGNTNIEKVSIPYNVTSIGAYCFQNATKLKSLTLPSSLKAIKAHAFDGCTSLLNFYLPSAITEIGDYCFNGCSAISKIGLPSRLQTLGSFALSGTKISELIIPSYTTQIGDGAFNGCKTLSKITFADGNDTLNLGFNGTKNQSIFYDCPIKEIYIGRHLSYDTRVGCGYSPFYNKTDLTNVTIMDAETDIYEYEFAGCSSLKEIVIPASVKYWRLFFPRLLVTLKINICGRRQIPISWL